MSTVQYDFNDHPDLCGIAVFDTQCPGCGQYAKAKECTVTASGLHDGCKTECTADCKKCGEVKLTFQGWF